MDNVFEFLCILVLVLGVIFLVVGILAVIEVLQGCA